MIDWATVAPAIKKAFTDVAAPAVSGGSFGADWNGRAQGFRHPSGAELTLRITRIDNDGGRDEPRAVMVDDGQGNISRVVRLFGSRLIAIEAKVESTRNTDALWAWAMVERLTTGIHAPDIVAGLRAAGVVVGAVEAAVPASAQVGGRELSAAVVQVAFRVGLYDPSGVPTDWIETVALSTDITGPNGASPKANIPADPPTVLG